MRLVVQIITGEMIALPVRTDTETTDTAMIVTTERTVLPIDVNVPGRQAAEEVNTIAALGPRRGKSLPLMMNIVAVTMNVDLPPKLTNAAGKRTDTTAGVARRGNLRKEPRGTRTVMEVG